MVRLHEDGLDTLYLQWLRYGEIDFLDATPQQNDGLSYSDTPGHRREPRGSAFMSACSATLTFLIPSVCPRWNWANTCFGCVKKPCVWPRNFKPAMGSTLLFKGGTSPRKSTISTGSPLPDGNCLNRPHPFPGSCPQIFGTRRNRSPFPSFSAVHSPPKDSPDSVGQLLWKEPTAYRAGSGWFGRKNGYRDHAKISRVSEAVRR